MKVKINLIMGNHISVGQEMCQTSSSKKYNPEKVLEERNTSVQHSNLSERFLKYLIKTGTMDDLDSIFMVP